MKKQEQLKEKKCVVCTFRFIPRVSLQKVCSPHCALELNRATKRKEFDKETARRKKALKKRSDWLSDTQTSCNTYIRLRDESKPCISCGRYHSGQYHAGHFKSVGSHPELRFYTLNIHKQCSVCNNHKSSNALEYRKRLIKKLGIEIVDEIEGPHNPKKYTIEYLVRMKIVFDKKIKLYKKLRGLQ